MNVDQITDWLLQGDASIQYQVYRDILNIEKPELQGKIPLEGWGKQFLSLRKPNGHWGMGFYQPKWISTHYTLLDLVNLSFPADHPLIKQSLELLLKYEKGIDGGLNPSNILRESDVCVNGMALNYFSYFKTNEKNLESIVDFLLSQKMPDGGFNCHSNRKGAVHSSLHTTLSVLEGIFQYKTNGYKYKLSELLEAEKNSIEFILMHRLYKSDKTGKIIRPDFLKLTYPPRWKYDIMRALDYFRQAGIKFDNRMQDALDCLLSKRNKENTWNQQAYHPGKLHFKMDEAGKPGRWNTLRAIRVLKYFNLYY